MSHKADVIVIGSGVIGSATAYYLAKKGARVVVLEKGRLGEGSSKACDGTVLLQSKSPGPHLTLALASERLYRTLPGELGRDIGYRQCGGMIVIEREAELETMRGFIAGQQRHGLDVSLISGDEARRLEPALAGHIVAASVGALDAQINPMLLVSGYLEAAVRMGARVFRNTPVSELIIKGGRAVGVSAGGTVFSAPAVVCCGGVWTPQLFTGLGLELPIRPRRGQLIVTEPVEPFINRVLICARYIAAKFHPELLEGSDDEALRLGVGLALEQTAEGGLLIGSTREFAGFERGVTERGTRAVASHAARIVPALKQIRVVRTFAGLRPYTPDGRAFMGAVPGCEGLYIAARHEGDGVAYAPITGKSMAELILDGSSETDLSPFALNRLPF